MNKKQRPAFTWIEFLVVLLILGVLAGMLGIAFVEAPFRLLVGWIGFLRRNIRVLTISPSGITMFVILAVATCGMIYVIGRDFAKRFGFAFRPRSAIAITVVIVALFAAGIGATGVAHQIGWMVGSPDPLLDGGGAAVLRFRDVHQQKDVALGIHLYHAADDSAKDSSDLRSRPFQRLTVRDSDGSLLHGWQTQILPFVEKQALYETVDLKRSWRAIENAAALSQEIKLYLRQETVELPRSDGRFGISHIAASSEILGNPAVGNFDDISDGLANTVMAGSAKGRFQPWGHPQNWRTSEFVPNQHESGFGSGMHGGCNMMMADGAVIFITDSIDPELWKALFTPQGEDSVEQFYR